MCADNVQFSGGANSSLVISCLLPPYLSPRSQVPVDVLRKAFTAPQKRAALSHSKPAFCTTSHNRLVHRTLITDNALEQQQQQ